MNLKNAAATAGRTVFGFAVIAAYIPTVVAQSLPIMINDANQKICNALTRP